jgi:glutathione S-transferase
MAMKLYYATGTCSLSPHIVALEAGIPLDLERVDISSSPHVTESGGDYAAINPNGYVPALRLDDGALLTEGAAIVQYLADLRPESQLAPPAGTRARVELQSWLVFIATELHKTFSPWLFHAEYGEPAQAAARARIIDRLAHVEARLAAGGPYLLGERFTAADAYLFTIAGWTRFTKIDLGAFPRLRDFMDRVAARPAVRAAMSAEGMKVAA